MKIAEAYKIFSQLILDGVGDYGIEVNKSQQVATRRDDERKVLVLSEGFFGQVQQALRHASRPMLVEHLTQTTQAQQGFRNTIWGYGTVREAAEALAPSFPVKQEKPDFVDKLWAHRKWIFVGAGGLLVLALIKRARR